jgi:hypothetical protein
MSIVFNKGKAQKGLSEEDQARLDAFIEKYKKGEIQPFKEKFEQGREDLKKAGLIK